MVRLLETNRRLARGAPCPEDLTRVSVQHKGKPLGYYAVSFVFFHNTTPGLRGGVDYLGAGAGASEDATSGAIHYR
jgi:hypothetical protein